MQIVRLNLEDGQGIVRTVVANAEDAKRLVGFFEDACIEERINHDALLAEIDQLKQQIKEEKNERL